MTGRVLLVLVVERAFPSLSSRAKYALWLVVLAKANQAEAARVRDSRKNGPDPDQLALAQAQLSNAQSQLAAAQAALSRMDLTAPYDGTVVEIDISVGEQAVPNQTAMVIADLSSWYVETSDLTEMDVVKLREGDTARIAPDALKGLSLPATITEIASSSGKKGGDVTYTVRLKLDGTDNRLRWGMTVEIRFARQ